MPLQRTCMPGGFSRSMGCPITGSSSRPRPSQEEGEKCVGKQDREQSGSHGPRLSSFWLTTALGRGYWQSRATNANGSVGPTFSRRARFQVDTDRFSKDLTSFRIPFRTNWPRGPLRQSRGSDPRHISFKACSTLPDPLDFVRMLNLYDVLKIPETSFRVHSKSAEPILKLRILRLVRHGK